MLTKKSMFLHLTNPGIKDRGIKFTFIMQLYAKALSKHHFRVYLIYSGLPVHGTVYFLKSKCHILYKNLSPVGYN